MDETRSLADDNTRNLASNSSSICTERHVQVKVSVLAYLAKLLERQKVWDSISEGLTLSGEVGSQQMMDMAKILVSNVPAKGSPSLATLNMQACMEEAYAVQRELLQLEHQQREEHIHSLLTAILSPALESEESPSVLKAVLWKVFDYVCRAAGMEHAMRHGPAHDEVRAALESVFPVSMLSRFLTLEQDEKEAQMEELVHIVLGIVLYNSEQGIGGRAIPEARGTFFGRAQQLDDDLSSRLAAASTELGTVLRLIGLRAPSVDPREPEMMRLTAEAANRRQHMAFINRMRAELHASMESASRLEGYIQEKTAEAFDAVGEKSSVPKNKVYPLFEEAGIHYMALRDEHRLLEVHSRLLEALDALQGKYTPTATAKACHAHRNDPKGPARVIPDSPSTPTDMAAAEALAGTQRVFPEDMADGTVLSLSGLCPVTLVRRVGLLLPGKLEIGVASINQSLYACADNEELAVFSSAPNDWIQAVEAVALSMPELCYLLNMHSMYPELSMKSAVELMNNPMACDSGTQTPTHFVHSYIDVNYSWNEWDLRRRALQLANIRNKKTRSQQTDKSHFRRDADTQVWLPKKASTQTAYNKGQSMPQKKRYIAGLRGSPATTMSIVSLDLDVGQPHQRKF